jgi:hypothetical protein
VSHSIESPNVSVKCLFKPIACAYTFVGNEFKRSHTGFVSFSALYLSKVFEGMFKAEGDNLRKIFHQAYISDFLGYFPGSSASGAIYLSVAKGMLRYSLDSGSVQLFNCRSPNQMKAEFKLHLDPLTHIREISTPGPSIANFIPLTLYAIRVLKS